jgi:hypothetical protein
MDQDVCRKEMCLYEQRESGAEERDSFLCTLDVCVRCPHRLFSNVADADRIMRRLLRCEPHRVWFIAPTGEVDLLYHRGRKGKLLICCRRQWHGSPPNAGLREDSGNPHSETEHECEQAGI